MSNANALSLLQSSSFGEGLIIGVAVCFTTTAPLYEYIRANQIQESSYGRVSGCDSQMLITSSCMD